MTAFAAYCHGAAVAVAVVAAGLPTAAPSVLAVPVVVAVVYRLLHVADALGVEIASGW